jgi:hypothetical protein
VLVGFKTSILSSTHSKNLPFFRSNQRGDPYISRFFAPP